MEILKRCSKDYLWLVVIAALLYCKSTEGADQVEEKPRVFKERRRHDNQYNNDDGFDENFIALAPDEAGIYSFDEMFSPQVLIELTNKSQPGDDKSTGSGKISYHIVYDTETEAAGARKVAGSITSTSTRQSVVLNDDTQDYDILMDDGDGDYYPDGNEQKLKSSYNSINHDGYDGENYGNLVDVPTTPQPPKTTSTVPSTTPTKPTTTTTTTTTSQSNRYDQYLSQLRQQERPQQLYGKKSTKSNRNKHSHKSSKNGHQDVVNFYDNNRFYGAYQPNYHKSDRSHDKWPHLTKVTKNLNREEQLDAYVPPYVKKFNRRNKQLNDLLDCSVTSGRGHQHRKTGHHHHHKQQLPHHQQHHHHHHHHRPKHHHHRDDWIENLFEEQRPNHTVTTKVARHPNELPDDRVHVIYDKSHYEKEKRKFATNQFDQNLQTNNNNFNAKISNFEYHRVEQPPPPPGTSYGRMKKQRLPYVAITDRKLGPPRSTQRRSIRSSRSISSLSSSSTNNNNQTISKRRK